MTEYMNITRIQHIKPILFAIVGQTHWSQILLLGTRTGHTEGDSQNGTGKQEEQDTRIGLPGKDCQHRAASTGLPAQGCLHSAASSQGKTERRGQPEWDS